MESYNYHKPVLLDEVLSFYSSNMKNIVDLTLGRGGHSSKILSKASKDSKFVGVDCDIDAISYSQKEINTHYSGKVSTKFILSKYSSSFPRIKEFISGADFILMDVGVSSPQFDDPSRGFSYRYDSTLDMRMNKTQSFTAKDIINNYSEEALMRVFKELGGVKVCSPVVKSIIQQREKKEILTTGELVDIIKSSLPKSVLRKEGHPAKQFFLGLRYEVNDELNELQKGVENSIKFLNKGGILIVISFNYKEDQLVKNIFKKYATKKRVDKYSKEQESDGYVNLTEKPIYPSKEEIEKNNRSKSAILRAIQRR